MVTVIGRRFATPSFVGWVPAPNLTLRSRPHYTAGRWAGLVKQRRLGMTLRNRLLGTLAAAAASMLLTTGTMGSAAAADPLPPAPFTYCPMHYTAQPLRFCFVSVGTGGTFKMGKVTVNLTPNTILQGGFVQDPVTYKVSFIDAEPASKTL